MTLAGELSAVFDHFQKNARDEFKQPILASKADFQKSFQPDAAIQVGDTLPEFRLSDAVGMERTSTELLAQGPLVITFYRGAWCPFCNLALAAMQKHLDEFKAKGVTLVAMTPELPDQSLTTAEKNKLQFPVLSDVGNKYAKQLGALFPMPDSVRPVFDKVGHDLEKCNGDDSFVVPVPATLLVDEKGIVRNTFIDPDYTKRVEPSLVLQWIDAMQS